MTEQDELKELYRQYGEVLFRLEFLQQKYVELKSKILEKLKK